MNIAEKLKEMEKEICPCGMEHRFDSAIYVGEGVLSVLPKELARFGAKKIYMLADKNTYAAAGERAEALMKENGFEVSSCIFTEDEVEPNEENTGSALLYYKKDTDVIVSVGSGVINDIGKILANAANRPYVIVATAPSMDGYASSSSSMTRDGLKVTIPSCAPDVIIGDSDILATAPLDMMKSGLGDMLAKYIALAEWRIGALLWGEHYCERVAALVREAVAICVSYADALLKRDKKAVEAVFEGLVLSGIAMKYVDGSRPASGLEHYFSHTWDMRGISFGTPVAFHGTQCAIGTLYAARLYEALALMTPDKEKALATVAAFDYDAWKEELRAFLGKGAESMIALEVKEKKYDKARHKKHIERIIENWDEILRIVKEEIPAAAELSALLDRLGAPKTVEDIGISKEILPKTFCATRDIRDKYILSRLAFDLGVTDELIAVLMK